MNKELNNKSKTKKIGIELLHLEDPIYRYKINVLKGGTWQDFREFMEKDGVSSESNNESNTKAMYVAIPDQNLYYLWIGKDADIAIIAHECSHVVMDIFNRLGVDISYKNQEGFAYSLEWWVSKVV